MKMGLKYLAFFLTIFSLLFGDEVHAQKTLLNVSYDPTRELYQDLNAAFVKNWQAKKGESISIKQSHGG